MSRKVESEFEQTGSPFGRQSASEGKEKQLSESEEIEAYRAAYEAKREELRSRQPTDPVKDERAKTVDLVIDTGDGNFTFFEAKRLLISARVQGWVTPESPPDAAAEPGDPPAPQEVYHASVMVEGQAGNDTLMGGAGADSVVFGGAGADWSVLTPPSYGSDLVTEFGIGLDQTTGEKGENSEVDQNELQAMDACLTRMLHDVSEAQEHVTRVLSAKKD